jgi:hypothetical protein
MAANSGKAIQNHHYINSISTVDLDTQIDSLELERGIKNNKINAYIQKVKSYLFIDDNDIGQGLIEQIK